MPSASSAGRLSARGAPVRRRHGAVRCCLAPANGRGRVVSVGDVVTVRFTCRDAADQIPKAALFENESLTFQIGASDAVRNRLFQGFDEAVRGLSEGQSVVLESEGGEWNPDLLFRVPMAHPEIQRLQGRYRLHGGLERGRVVELLNKQLALVVDVDATHVTLDANNMMAGRQLSFEIRVEEIQSDADGDASRP